MDKGVVQNDKGVDERIDEGLLQWFGIVERMEDRIAKRVYVGECAGSHSVERMEDRIAKRVYVGECVGSHSVGRLRKKWIDIVNDCLRQRGLDVRQARRMVQDRSA